jgi:hypothetical protein
VLPVERPLGMGGSQSAGWSAEAVDLSATKGERECLRVVEAEGTTLTGPYNGATRTGAVLEEFERRVALDFIARIVTSGHGRVGSGVSQQFPRFRDPHVAIHGTWNVEFDIVDDSAANLAICRGYSCLG